jgi:hypothetical protein
MTLLASSFTTQLNYAMMWQLKNIRMRVLFGSPRGGLLFFIFGMALDTAQAVFLYIRLIISRHGAVE